MRDLPHPITIKTSAPSLEGVIERPRLVTALAQLSAAAKWLQSPSGTGKSTLAASYAHSCKKQLVWYRLDERDNDPAFFYAEFADAIHRQLRLKKTLPKFSSDDHDQQRQFAQRFAAALSGQLTKPALIVLDDVQCITSEAMQQAFAALTGIASTSNEVLFVSQSTAPIAFFDAIAARQLALLNDADLRFDLDECNAMITALRIGDAHSESIAALTGGHAGALILACELLRGTDPKSALGIETVERIHAHLLGKLVERMPQPRRELWLKTAFVTQLTRQIAEELAGVKAVGELQALVDSGLLRRIGDVTNETFEAHGLVQQGMRALVQSLFGQTESRALAHRTAATLIANDQPEAAFALLIGVGLTARAIEVLQQLSERYARRGQTDLLLSALAKVPRVDVDNNPWLCFWTGQALLRINEEQARGWFGRSYTAFEKAADRAGMRLAAASVVIAFGLEYGDLRELETWIRRHRDAGGDTPIASTERFEPTLLMAIICAAFMEGKYPLEVDSESLIQRLRQLLELPDVWLSEDQRVQAGRQLIEHARIFRNQVTVANAIVATRRLIDGGLGGSLHKGRWLCAAAQACFEEGNPSESLSYLQQAQALAEQSNSLALRYQSSFLLSDHWMKAQMLAEAAEELNRLERIAEISAPAERAEFARLMARLLLLQGRHAEGLRRAEDALRLAVPAGFCGATLRPFEIELVYALAANDRLSDALEVVKRHDAVPMEAGVAIAQCLEFLTTGCGDLQLLRSGLKMAEQIDFINLLDRARNPLTRVCEAAMANGIETEFVRRLITIKKLGPSLHAGPSWPWNVRIRSLGGFRLEIASRPYRPSHKAQDKPLELLKLLVTSQVLGRESADKNWIIERLWGDADADRGRKSLDMTISRLRKLLECEDAIVISEGRVELSSMHVWTDITPLRRALASMNAARDDHASGRLATTDQAAASVKAVLNHYQGVYFAEEEGPAWLLAGREAIASNVRHALVTADRILDGSADAQLIPALQRALLHDPGSEDLARSLMRAYLRSGQNSEALGVYRRLREMLSLLMGLAPSPETEHIHKQALLQEAH